MSSLNKIVSDIQNIATSGSLTVDFRIEQSQIVFWVNEIRSMLISQAIEKGRDLSNVWIQPITCLALIEVDKSECCDITTNCKILRTQLQIPETIEVRGMNAIVEVTKPNGDVISRTNNLESKYAKFSKYTGNKSRWFLRNKYIYIINEIYLESININGIFEDPSELSLYTACDGDTCFNSDSPYPCSLKMANDITNIVFKTKVYPFIQMPQDNTNDASNSLQGLNSVKQT